MKKSHMFASPVILRHYKRTKILVKFSLKDRDVHKQITQGDHYTQAFVSYSSSR